MPQYRGLSSVLEAALGEDYTSQGYRLQEIADDELVLWHRDEHVATFYQVAATIELIRQACGEGGLARYQTLGLMDKANRLGNRAKTGRNEMRLCEWCKELFDPKYPDQIYCKGSHRLHAAALRRALSGKGKYQGLYNLESQLAEKARVQKIVSARRKKEVG